LLYVRSLIDFGQTRSYVAYDWKSELAVTGDRSEYVKKVIRLLV